jgi:hypothetical protein
MLVDKIHTLSDDELVDMLSHYTSKYAQLFSERSMDSRDFKQSKLMVRYLQKEIESRKDPDLTRPPFDISNGDIF